MRSDVKIMAKLWIETQLNSNDKLMNEMMANCWKRNGKLWKSDGEQCRRWGTTHHQGWMAKLAENFSGVVSRPNAFMGPGSGARFLQKIRRRWGVTQQHARSECKAGGKLVWCWVVPQRQPGSEVQLLCHSFATTVLQFPDNFSITLPSHVEHFSTTWPSL